MFLKAEVIKQECNSTRCVHVIMELKCTLQGVAMKENCKIRYMVWL